MANENVLEFTEQGFASEVLQSDVPVLVDFWAEWCQPCRLLGPTIDKLASAYKGKAKIGKLDIEQHQKVAFEYQISSIPTILIFKGGQVAKRFVGLTQEPVLSAALNEVAAK